MQRSDLFAYLSAFVTIVLALAVGDMVQSVHRLIAARDRVRWHLLPAASATLVFMMVVSEFFSLARLFGVPAINYYGVIGLLLVPGFASLAAFASLPDHVPDEGLDLLAFYMRNRPYLYGVLIAGIAADFIRTCILLLGHGDSLLSVGLLRSGLIAAGCIAIYAALIAWRSLLVQWIGLGCLLALYIAGFANWTLRVAG